MRLPIGVLLCFQLAGCGLLLDFDPPDEPLLLEGGYPDGGVADASLEAGMSDAGNDAGMDADLPDAGHEDAGDGGFDASLADAGDDAGYDASFDADIPDAGMDADLPDAGPPRILVYRYERADRPEGARSVWVSEDTAPWRRVACTGGIVSGPVSRCGHDVIPLPVGQRLRFYFDYDFGGIAPACGSDTCEGVHRALLDGVDMPVMMEAALDTPAAPGFRQQVYAFTTPP